MKPTQEKILSSIQENKSKKELLSVQKVDLGLIDDVKKLYDKGQNNYSDALASGQKTMVKLQVAINFFEKTEQEFEKAEKMAKELGVDMPGKALRNQAKEWLQDSNKFFNALKSNV